MVVAREVNRTVERVVVIGAQSVWIVLLRSVVRSGVEGLSEAGRCGVGEAGRKGVGARSGFGGLCDAARDDRRRWPGLAERSELVTVRWRLQ